MPLIKSVSSPQDFESFDNCATGSFGTLNDACIQLLNNLSDHPHFDDGLGHEIHRTGELRSAAETSHFQVYDYIAKHTNPHQISGMLNNLFSCFSTGALNQNCIICSKAVERNLEAVVKGVINDFWVAESTKQGYLPCNISPETYSAFLPMPDEALSRQLLDNTQVNNRYIISIPVKNKGFGHAVNLINSNNGVVVIDGQFGKTYNLNTHQGRYRFDSNYGTGNTPIPVQIYLTGEAPKALDYIESEQLDDWEIIDPSPTDDVDLVDKNEHLDDWEIIEKK
jgi:hypothetical protein